MLLQRMAVVVAVLFAVTSQASAAEELTVLSIGPCGAGSRISCAAPPFQKVWRKVEAANGSAIKVDMASIERFRDGTRRVLLYGPYVPGAAFDPALGEEIGFDCAGHYYRYAVGGVMDIAPPRSLIGAVATIVCSH